MTRDTSSAIGWAGFDSLLAKEERSLLPLSPNISAHLDK